MAYKFWILGCCILTGGPVTAPLRAQDTRPNVVVILADQLRANRLHLYGNSRPTSPNLDQLAAQGVQFTRFYSVAPWTAPSQASIATSLYPSRHGETLVSVRTDPPAFRTETTTMAELFRAAGYHTAAFVNNGVAGPWLLGRGFDEFDARLGWDGDPASRGAAANQRMMAWLHQQHPQPFFLYVDYYEPHYPYAPPPEHDIFRSRAYPGQTQAGYDAGNLNLFRWAKIGDRRAVDRAVQLYDGYIHYMDSNLGRLIDEFRKTGLFDNTIFLFTSDHGELLFSHPEDYLTADHRSLYDDAVGVPGVMWGKGIPAGRKIGAMVTNLDIAPTLLDMAGVAPKADAQGVSLAPLIRQQVATVHDYVFAEQDMEERLRSVRDRTHKLIVNLDSGDAQLFDTRNDPGEMQDVSSAFPDVMATLQEQLDRWMQDNDPGDEVRLAWWHKMLASQYPVVAPAGPAPSNDFDEVYQGTNFHLTGDRWRLTDQRDNYKGGAYWTLPAGQDQSVQNAIWRPNNPMFGRFRISMWWGSVPGMQLGSDVPVTVVTAAGPVELRVDETEQAGMWNLLGEFTDPIRVVMSNEANGAIIADAILIEKIY